MYPGNMWEFKTRPETTPCLAFPKYSSSFNNLICSMKDERNIHWHVRSEPFSAALTSSACQGRKQSAECVSGIFPKRERRKTNAEMVNNNSARQSAARRKWLLLGVLANSSAHLQGLPADQEGLGEGNRTKLASFLSLCHTLTWRGHFLLSIRSNECNKDLQRFVFAVSD